MLGIQTKIKHILFRSLVRKSIMKFPQKGVHALIIKSYLNKVKKILLSDRKKWNLGWLLTPPNPLAIWTYRFFVDVNPNHLGNWSTQPNAHGGTQKLEQENIQALIDLYHADKSHLEGYITSGGTEGNLFSVWAGNAYLKKHCTTEKICLLHTSLTHYSVVKAAHIANVDIKITPLNSSTWSMDPDALVFSLHHLSLKGYRGFLIPLTLGYTLTGTSDHIDDIIKKINKFHRTHPHIRCYLWIDAALNGLITPFISTRFTPFQSRLINTIVVDFHKFGGTPYPAGVILYRRRLRKLIEKPIDYLPDHDNTVLGSRPGAAAASIWTMIQLNGVDGFKTKVYKQKTILKYFLQRVLRIFPHAHIIDLLRNFP